MKITDFGIGQASAPYTAPEQQRGEPADHRSDIFPFGALFGNEGRHDRSIVTFYLLECRGVGPDLAWLAGAVAAGRLAPQISWRGSWKDVAEATGTLLERRLHGKAVLEID
mgnify:CR=1 FL=1